MSDPAPPPRPRQVTTGALLIVLGAVFLVVFAFQRMASVGSMEFQESVRNALADPPADGLGVSVDDVQTAVRVLCFISAAGGVAAAILAREALRRSTSARWALSVIAPILFLAGFAVSAFTGAFVVVGVVMLWMQPSREWFLGRTPPRAPVLPPSVRPTTLLPPPPAAPAPPPPVAPAAPTYAEPQFLQSPYPYPAQYAPNAAHVAPPATRPGAATAAYVVAWVACAVVGAVAALVLLVMLAAHDDMLDRLRDQGTLQDTGLSDHEFVASVIALTSVLVVWSAAAAALAVVAFRRIAWAWVAVLVSAGVAALLCALLLVVGGVVAIVPLAACGTSFALLMRPDVRAWYSSRSRV